MLTIITPCYRQANIPIIYNSIVFDKIDKWIIVYDTSKDRKYNKLYDHPKILEVECNIAGRAGHPQRNFGMSLVDDGFIYFLDDDNIIHPNFWKIEITPEKFYTFDQIRKANDILKGNKIKLYFIDTAMFIVHKKHIGNIKWLEYKYNADGYFICDIFYKNPESHVYIDSTCSYYNYLSEK